MSITASVIVAVFLNVIGYIMGAGFIVLSFESKKIWHFLAGIALASIVGGGTTVWFAVNILNKL